MRLDLSFEEPRLSGDLPMTPASLKRFVRSLAVELKRLPEWRETCEILGETPSCVALHFCGDAEMRRIHREFRRLDKTTDVLSFPSREQPEPELAALAGELSLGDLVIAYPTVLRAARRVKRKPEAELAEVLAHGLLHLLGLDHVGVSKARADRMKELQRRLSRQALLSIKAPHGRTARRAAP